ncbi:MAG: DMT family transporter [Planctomycetota bacterium]|jgi:drug/metabolite transporter (DMT)-like permease|nr:DMT family transporter [Planctomycetota bacterium]
MRTALAKLHVSIVLAGFTGVFGKLISLGEIPLVWWRLALVLAILCPALALTGRLSRPSRRSQAAAFGAGGLQCLHWVLFYASIKLSTVSVALVCISLMGFFSALFSPSLLGSRWSAREFLHSGISVAGIALIFHFDSQYRLGIAVGVVSSAIAALFVICTKRIDRLREFEAANLFFHEMLGGWVLITLSIPLYLVLNPGVRTLPDGKEFLYLLILSFFCTIVLYIMQLQALRRLSAFTVNLSLNLEPVYSIIIAAWLLGEAKDFTSSFYAGLALLLLSVILQTRAAVLDNRREEICLD